MLKKGKLFPPDYYINLSIYLLVLKKKITEKKIYKKRPCTSLMIYYCTYYSLTTSDWASMWSKKIKESGVFSIILHQMIVNVKKKICNYLYWLHSKKTTFLPFSWFYSYFLFFETICDQLFWLLFNSRALCFVVS